MSAFRLAVIAVSLALAAPALAQPLPHPPHRYLNLALSPDGTRLASVEGELSPDGGYYPVVRELVLRSVAGGTSVSVPLPCGQAPQCWPSDPAWSPDGKRLVFALRTPGGHARALYQVDADGGGLTRLLEFGGTLVDLKFSADGRLAMLATASADKEVGATEAGAPVLGDVDTPPPEQRIAVLDGDRLDFITPPDLFVYEFAWRPGQAGFIGTAAHGDGDNNWWIAKLYAFDGQGSRVIFDPPDARHQIADPTVSPDGRTAAFISGIMSDFGSTGGDIYALPLAGGVATDLTPGMPASATALTWGCDGRLNAQLLAGAQSQVAAIGALDHASAPQVLWQGPVGLGDLAPLACPSGVTAVTHEDYTHAQEVEVGPVGAWHDVTHANLGLGLDAEVRSLTWTSDGHAVQGWLVLPKAAQARLQNGKLPMIVEVHGGPAAANEPRFLGPGVPRALIEHGYALFYPNPRGSYGQGEAFTAANARDFGYGDLRDILAGVDEAEHVAPIDEARLGVAGGSYGGYMTMWTVTQTHRFKAAVAQAGVSDWLSYYGENGIDQWMIPYFGASVYDDPQVYARSAPMTFIKQVTTPTFEYVGADDIECPPPQTQEFWHALHDLGVPTSMVIYPDEGHGLRDPAHIADAQKRTLDWFDKYLK